MFNQTQQLSLEGPLDSRVVSQRQQAGLSLSYLESWYVIKRANEIFGYSQWSSRTLDLDCLVEEYDEAKKMHRVSYSARCEIEVSMGLDASGLVQITKPPVRQGVGHGHGMSRHSKGEAHESAAKEAESDAQKRALKSFGNQFGLALYDKEQKQVADGEAIEKAFATVLQMVKDKFQGEDIVLEGKYKLSLDHVANSGDLGIMAAIGKELKAIIERGEKGK